MTISATCRRFSLLRTLGFTLGCLLLFTSPGLAFDGEDAEQFRKGRELAWQNCSDCADATKEGIEEAIALLEPLLEKRSKDTELHRILAELYRQLAIGFYAKGSQGRAEYENREREVLSIAVGLEPGNLNLLHSYAMTYRGEERIALLKKIVSLDNDHVEAYNALSREVEDPTQRLQYARKAYELASPVRRISIGRNLFYDLVEHASDQEVIEFHLRYHIDRNAAENAGVSQSKNIQLTLHAEGGRSVDKGDVPINVHITNIDTIPHPLINHQSLQPMFFWFKIYPEKSLFAAGASPFESGLSEYQAADPATIMLPPGETLIVETTLQEIFGENIELPDGGYVIWGRYRGKAIGDIVTDRGTVYSNALHIDVKDFNSRPARSTN